MIREISKELLWELRHGYIEKLRMYKCLNYTIYLVRKKCYEGNYGCIVVYADGKTEYVYIFSDDAKEIKEEIKDLIFEINDILRDEKN